jgi:hypothetical protein
MVTRGARRYSRLDTIYEDEEEEWGGACGWLRQAVSCVRGWTHWRRGV